MGYRDDIKKKVCNFNDYNVNYYSSKEKVKIIMTMKFSNNIINWHIHNDKNTPDVIEGNETLAKAHFCHIFDSKILFKNRSINKSEYNGCLIGTSEAMKILDTNKVDLNSRFENTMKNYFVK